MTVLDPDYVNRAAPPGSMHYFALLYASPEQRSLLTALFVIEAEIRTSATQVAHEVAHSRLQWWRAEIDRLSNRNAQHPATLIVQAAMPKADVSVLHELLVAADMDLARMTYNTDAELNAYLERSGGVILDLFACAPGSEERLRVRQIGAFIRRIETIRDLVAEARVGRVYWPMNELTEKHVSLEQLKANTPSDAACALLADATQKLDAQFKQLKDMLSLPEMRPVMVLAALHGRLLQRIARADYDVFTQRHELGPLDKVWTAWRAARRS